MMYKIEKYTGESWYSSKEALFSILDSYSSGYNKYYFDFYSTFVDSFIFSKKTGKWKASVNVEYLKLYDYNDSPYYQKKYVNTYVNGLYVIKDDKGRKICLFDFFESYKQSRKVKSNKRTYYRNWGSVKETKSRRLAKYWDSNSAGLKTEYALNIEHKKDFPEVRIREKRNSYIREVCSLLYDDDYIRICSKSWKDQSKYKKQWMKKAT